MVRVAVPQYPEQGQDVELTCMYELQGDRLYSVSWYKDYSNVSRTLPTGWGLRMVRVAVPQYPELGQDVKLTCMYELQGDSLYSVSWYKDYSNVSRALPTGWGLRMVRVAVPQYPELGQNVKLTCMYELQGDRLYSVSWYKDYSNVSRALPTGWGLRMVRVAVPQYPELGQDVELTCMYELQGDRLYSVSWYKDYMEFYRFVPRGSPSQHVHRMEGINVDLERSDGMRVVLLSIPLKASGLYMCEVSAEAPYFTSVHGQAWMSVVVLPQEAPRISGGRPHYATGQELSLNCTAGPSHPAPRLQWFLNGHQVMSESQAVTHRHSQLLSSSAELRLMLRPEHFHHGRLKVRCLASLPTPHHTLREANLIALRGGESQQHLSTPLLLFLAVVAVCS